MVIGRQSGRIRPRDQTIIGVRFKSSSGSIDSDSDGARRSGMLSEGSMNQPVNKRRAFRYLTDRDADPLFLAPHDVGMLTNLAAADAQRDLVGNAFRARNLKAGADGGDVANDAIDSRAVEL